MRAVSSVAAASPASVASKPFWPASAGTETATGVTVTLSGIQPYSKSAGLRPVRSAYSSQLTYTELPVKVFVKYPISRLAPVGSFQASGQAVASIVPESAASASPFTQ